MRPLPSPPSHAPASPAFPAPSARATARRRMLRQHSQLATLLLLDALETRVLMAGTATQLFLPQLNNPLTSVGSNAPTITVTVADATGATVTTDSSTVVLTLAQNPGGGSLTQNGKLVGSITATAKNGVATFSNVSFSVAGQYVINVNDGSLAGTQSNLFTVLSMATHLAFNVPPGNVSDGTPFSQSVQVYVEDANNSLVSTNTDTISLSLSSTAGTLTGGTVTSAVGGIATFKGLAVLKPGTYTLTAKDVSSTSNSITSVTSISFTVSAGAPAAVVFDHVITNSAAGATVSAVVVDIVDSFGSIVTSDSSAVTLSINTGPQGASLLGTTTVNAVGGQATFNDLVLPQAGAGYSLKATDGTLTIGTSTTFGIWGAPTQLAFVTQPVQTTINIAMGSAVTVAVEDSFGTVVGTDSSTVQIVVGSGPGTVSGTTSAAAVNGIASFSGLTFNAMGTYTLTASDGGLTGANSSSFIINGTAAQLAFLVQPSAVEAGVPIAPSVIVEVEDSAGNLVVTDTSTVTISLGSGPGALSGTTTMTAVHGTASFSALKLSLAGTYTLAAADGSLTGAVSTSFLVLPAASQLVFVQQPSAFASGGTMYPYVSVEILDSAGNVATTNTSSVTLQLISWPRNGSISGTTTVTAVNGIATFTDLTGTVQGTYQFIAIDGSLGTTVSRTFNISAPTYQLQWAAQPETTLVAGATLNNITAWVEDRNKNVVLSDHTVVTLATVSGPTGGAIIGNTTANAINGLVTFSGISFTVAGTYKLEVTDGTLVGASSHTFTVVAAASTSHLVLTQSPASVLVGNTFSKALVVAVEDTYGNIINVGSQISLAVASGPGNLHGNTVVNASGGKAWFNNLSVDQAGTYTLMASDPALNNATASFSLTVGQVVSRIATPSTAAVYTAGEDFTLKTKLTGVVNSPSPWTGTVELLDSNNVSWQATSQISAGGNVTLFVTGGVGGAAGAGMTAGTYTMRLRYDGDSNHLGTISSPFTLVVGPKTTVTLKPSAKQIVGGGTLNLGVTVSGGSGLTLPSGVVQLLDNGVVIDSQTLAASTSSHNTSAASFNVAATDGSHTFTVAYAGDLNFRGSTSAASTVLFGLPTTTALSASTSKLAFGESFTLTANVKAATSGAAARTGSVELLDGTTVVATQTLNASSQAFFTVSPTVGTHKYSAIYLGSGATGTYRGSTSKTGSISVSKEGTSITTTPSATGIIYAGTSFTLNVQVTAIDGATTPATGSVVLKDQGAAIASMSLNSNGRASFTLTPNVGTHVYTVCYIGDANYLTSTSGKSTLKVKDATTVIPSTTAQINVGQTERLAVTVTAVNSVGARPTGVVQLYENFTTGSSTLLKSLTLNNGQGVFVFTPTQGSHTYSLDYLGDANYKASGPATVTLNVVSPPTATVTLVTPSATEGAFGTAFTLDAQVSVFGSNTTARTGTLTLKDGGTIVSSITLNSTSSSYGHFSVNPTLGTHTYTVVYSGDASFATSTSSATTLKVDQAATAVNLAPSAAQIPGGGTYSLTATVVALDGASTARTGTVNLMQGTTVISSATLNGASQATFVVSPTVGNYTYTVAYGATATSFRAHRRVRRWRSVWRPRPA